MTHDDAIKATTARVQRALRTLLPTGDEAAQWDAAELMVRRIVNAYQGFVMTRHDDEDAANLMAAYKSCADQRGTVIERMMTQAEREAE